MKKKKILILLVVTILVFITILIIYNSRVTKIEYKTSTVDNIYQPEFMNNEEKASFGLPEDSKIQVMKRNDKGEVDIYKIIREEADIEYN